MDGFLIIDKPKGITSHDVVRAVRRALKIRRVGHTGTLDPMATGVLPVAVGFATRLVEYLSTDDKSYLATMKLGAFTDTQDAEGEVTATLPYDGLQRPHVEEVVENFLGEIEQVPPMFSAVKIQGKPLYKLARKGIEIEREARKVRIYRLEIRSFEPPMITFDVTCSKGTYIRTLCRDIAEALETAGHLVALRRIRSGGFSLADTISLEDIEQTPAGMVSEQLLSMEEGMKRFPGYEISPLAVERLMNGIPPVASSLEESPVCREGEIVTLRKEDKLLAVARFAPQRKIEKRGDFELLKVFSQN
ncbi:MAG: tRNA pseudouridine(55) synthase TruB [Deltaproteobacteria bacterium]|nr:tRNA pseudouridine(55) synthase TruB [Deltaproteobacteria bacterium]